MSEAWRRKTYYRKRILIQTQAVLDSSIPGGVVCLTGGQINLLRALLEYADRRSTFVSEYHDTYYLAPTEAEWEQILDVVAETAEALVSCTEIETLLEQIRVCVCTAARSGNQPTTSPLDGQPDYDNYTSPVEEDVGDPPAGFADWAEWKAYKCKSAQMVLDDVYEWVTNLEELATLFGTITFAAVETALVGSLVGIPLAVVLLIVAFFTGNLVDWVWDSAATWLLTHKQGLVCEIYTADTVDAAKGAINTFFDTNWDLPFLDGAVRWAFTKRVLSYCFDGDLPDYSTREASYSETYCDTCEAPPLPLTIGWDFPPDTDWDVSASGVYYDGSGVMHWDVGSGSVDAIGPTYLGLDPATYDILVESTGRAPDGNFVVKIDSSPDGQDWTERWSQQQGSGSAPRCIAIGDHTGQITWDAAWTYIRFRIRNRVNDTSMDCCTIDFTFTPQ